MGFSHVSSFSSFWGCVILISPLPPSPLLISNQEVVFRCQSQAHAVLLSHHMAHVGHAHQLQSPEPRSGEQPRSPDIPNALGARECQWRRRRHSSEYRCDPSIWTFTLCKVAELIASSREVGAGAELFPSCSSSDITPQTHSFHTKASDEPKPQSAETQFPSINKLQRSPQRDPSRP